MSLQAISAEVLQGVLALQGKEILRLKAALTAAQNRAVVLERKTTTLRQPSSAGDGMPGLVPPSYRGASLLPFGRGKGSMTKQHFKDVLRSVTDDATSRTNTVAFNANTVAVRWEDQSHDVFSVVMPDFRVTKDRMKTSFDDRYGGGLEVSQMNNESGLRYYLGRYHKHKEETVTLAEYWQLPPKIQERIARVCGSKGKRVEAQNMLKNGQIPLKRLFLKRSGFNQKLYHRLLDGASGRAALVAGGSAEQGASDVDSHSADD